MPVDLYINSGATGNTNTASADPVEKTNTVGGFFVQKGIGGVSVKTGNEANSANNDKPELEGPKQDVNEFLEEPIQLDKESAEMLGTSDNTNIREFLGALDKALNQPGIDLSKLTSDSLDLLCLVLCQESKSKLITTLKHSLNAKVQDRERLQNEYQEELSKIAEQQAKAKKEFKKNKIRNIFKAVFSVIGAVLAVAASVVATVLTVGAATPAIVASGIALGSSVVGAGATIATTTIDIVASHTSDEDKKKKLSKASMVLGISGAILGLASAISSGAASALNTAKAVKEIALAVQKVTNVADSLTAAAGGAVTIAEGASNIKLAKMQKNLDNLKIEAEKTNESIELLSSMIEDATEVIQDFIDNLLQCEAAASKEISRQQDVQLRLAEKVC